MNLNVLVVDDSAVVRNIMTKAIKLSGLPLGDVYGAPDGSAALEVLRRNPVDLVFSDINMPEMNGVELISRMASDEALAAIPVIVVSTDGSEERMHELAACGVKAYIRKPFTPEQIRDVVHGVFPNEAVV